MMKTIFKVLLLFVSCLMLACTDLDELLSGDDVHTAILRFEGGIEGYDVKTRATTSVWPDGARIYVQYQTDNGVKNGSAVYRRSSDTWTFTYNGTLTQGKAMSCSVYYFENPSSMTATDVILNEQSAAYADAEASYFFEDGTMTIQGILKPLLGRIRFKGTAGTSFTLSGLKWYTGYSNASNSLSQLSGTLSLKVGSNGYTPYIYAQFADASARTLSLTYLGVTYTKKFADKVLALGRSGYLNIPSEISLQGWVLQPGDTPEDVVAVDLGLTSGTLWANMNVGASHPYDSGYYYAWGETEEKSDHNYLLDYYKYWSADGGYQKIGKASGSTYELAGLIEYDPAAKDWGSNWCMPTLKQMNELVEECTWEWVVDNANYEYVPGYLIKSKKNTNSIFLPAVNYYSGKSKGSFGRGRYWTSSYYLPDDLRRHAWALSIEKDGAIQTLYDLRQCGMPIRPVVYDSGNNRITITANGVSFDMIKVKAGTFQMGQVGVATPVHQVTLTNDYYIGETEVTQELWTAVMGSNPSHFTSSNQLPVEMVSWDDCQTFITKLNALTGCSFRLPTEAEWEYAARGGNTSKGYTYSGSNNIDDVAWYWYNIPSQSSGTTGYGTQLVATKAPNELGIYDMSGNVWEWCQDWYGSYSSSAQTNPTGPSSGSNRVFRGGSWGSYDNYCRVANRNWNDALLTGRNLGLRLAL